MSTGISISSINRIKELAEEKRYAEALEILDTQNLDKSINPQFLRISGEIFRENQRYYDSRRILLKAHSMSPQGLRIIAELIQLYLELGYFSKAEKYYEQYLFYTTPDDAQKEYVEYIMKKGMGADVKELASILVPILERMPEDKWNFEAVLLYDKMERKDRALDECRYILENFKDSVYVQPAIDYIDDKLDVDALFYVYPRQEKEEDSELYADLIEEEEKLLEADYLRMYPPEAKIMVEAEDKEGIDIKPAKEKKPRRKKKKSEEDNSVESSSSDELADNSEEVVEHSVGESDVKTDIADDRSEEISEEQIKKDREAALEKLLSKKINTEQIRESAKQAAKAVRDIDTTKAKEQVKSVAEVVKDNVKKATDVFGEAVGVKTEDVEVAVKNSEEIVDGIIESVLEPPKKAVGQVVTNEELDALIPESLEAMSTDEIADLEERKAEEERLELEALEAQLKLEEEKKAKSPLRKLSLGDSHGDESEDETTRLSDEEYAQLKEKFLSTMDEEAEEQPLDSLGFIKVVQSDVDAKMEEEIPDTAGILHQMIDNKEFYTGEDSTKFESKSSYENHGFEVEDYEIGMYEESAESKPTHTELYDNSFGDEEDVPTVEVIFAQEDIIDFSEIIPEAAVAQEEVVQEELVKQPVEEQFVQEEPVREEVVQKELAEQPVEEQLVQEEPVEEKVVEQSVWDNSVLEETIQTELMEEPVVEQFTQEEPIQEEIVQEEIVQEGLAERPVVEQFVQGEPIQEELAEQPVEKQLVQEEPVQEETMPEELVKQPVVEDWVKECLKEETPVTDTFTQKVVTEESYSDIAAVEDIEDVHEDKRQVLRVKILITEDMTRKLRELKESR